MKNFLVFLFFCSINLYSQNTDRYSLKEMWQKMDYVDMPDIAIGDSFDYVYSYLKNEEKQSKLKEVTSIYIKEEVQIIKYAPISYRNSYSEFVFFENKLMLIYLTNHKGFNHIKELPYNDYLLKEYYPDGEDPIPCVLIELYSVAALLYDCVNSGCGELFLVSKEFLPFLKGYRIGDWSIDSIHVYQLFRHTLLTEQTLQSSAYRILLDEQPVSFSTEKADELFYSGDIEAAKIAYSRLLNNNIDIEYVKKQLKRLGHTEKVWANSLLGKAMQNSRYFEDIHTIDVSNQNIYCVPKLIKKAYNLKSLNLSGNPRLRSFPNNLFLEHLEFLDISETGFKHLPNEMLKFRKLHELKIANNPQLMQSNLLRKIFKTYRHLSYLSLANNNLSIIPEEINQLLKLCKLNLSKNINLQYLPSSIYSFNQLKIILSDNNYHLEKSKLKYQYPNIDFEWVNEDN